MVSHAQVHQQQRCVLLGPGARHGVGRLVLLTVPSPTSRGLRLGHGGRGGRAAPALAVVVELGACLGLGRRPLRRGPCGRGAGGGREPLRGLVMVKPARMVETGYRAE